MMLNKNYFFIKTLSVCQSEKIEDYNNQEKIQINKSYLV